jgi:hypothetical protein
VPFKFSFNSCKIKINRLNRKKCLSSLVKCCEIEKIMAKNINQNKRPKMLVLILKLIVIYVTKEKKL